MSVPSNIVEGCARDSEADYLRFLNIAFGSLRELHYQLNLSKRLGFLRKKNSSLLEIRKKGQAELAPFLSPSPTIRSISASGVRRLALQDDLNQFVDRHKTQESARALDYPS